MKWIVLLLTLLLAACNSQQSKLSSIGGIGGSTITDIPYITNVTVPAATIYGAGADLDFTVTFSEPVTVDGTPRITFQTDDGLRYALYQNGTGTNVLQFKYTIAADVLDDNGIILSQAIDLNGGSIYDPIENDDALLTFSYVPTWGIMINARDASLVSITPPAGLTYSPGQTLRFIANFNSRVCGTGNPRLPLNIGGNTRYAVRVAEGCATTMKFDYVVQGGETDNDGIQLTGISVDVSVIPSAIKDSFGDTAVLNYTAATYPTVKVGAPPAPAELAPTTPAAGWYKLGDEISFALNFADTINVSGGTPHLSINVGGTTRTANYYALSNNSTSVVFKYTVQAGDMDADGIAIGAISYNSASFKGPANQTVTPAPAWGSNVIMVDGIVPTITSIGNPVDGIYRPGAVLDFTVNWSESVTFTGSTPFLYLTFDSHMTLKEAHSHTNNGLITTYRYSIQNADADFNGITAPVAALTKPPGSDVKDAAGNSAEVTFSPMNMNGVYIVPAGVDHWYDARNTTSTVASGPNLSQFKDLISTKHFSVVSAPPVGGNPRKISFSNAGQSITLSTIATFEKIFIVTETGGSAPGYVAFSSANAAVTIDFFSGIASTTNFCGACAKYFNGTSWNNTAAGTGNFGTYALNSKKIIMLDFQGQPTVALNFGSGFIGHIHEIFILSGASSTTNAAEVYRALQQKHTGATITAP